MKIIGQGLARVFVLRPDNLAMKDAFGQTIALRHVENGIFPDHGGLLIFARRLVFDDKRLEEIDFATVFALFERCRRSLGLIEGEGIAACRAHLESKPKEQNVDTGIGAIGNRIHGNSAEPVFQSCDHGMTPRFHLRHNARGYFLIKITFQWLYPRLPPFTGPISLIASLLP